MPKCRVLLGCALLLGGPVLGQPPGVDLSRAPVLAPQLLLAPEVTPPPPPPPANRVRLFRIQPGFVTGVPWLDAGEDAAADPGPDWVSFAAGNDNPYFDLRQRGDPGGVGFARVHTQVQLFGTGQTAVSLGLQAVTPLGIEFEGLPDQQGTTVVSPALAFFHTLEEGTAFQAFVGTHVPVLNRTTQPIRRDVQCGLAVQRALAVDAADPLSGLFVSLSALGQTKRLEDVGRSTTWDLVPGLHWQPGPTWSISGGLMVPLTVPRADLLPRWQVTAAWVF